MSLFYPHIPTLASAALVRAVRHKAKDRIPQAQRFATLPTRALAVEEVVVAADVL